MDSDLAHGDRQRGVQRFGRRLRTGWSPLSPHLMLRFIPLFLLALSGCSLVGPDSDGSFADNAEAKVINRASETLFVWAMDEDTLALIDLDLGATIPLTDQNRHAVVKPGKSTVIDVEAYDPGDSMFVFVYRVCDDGATYRTSVRIEGEDFTRDRGIVTITRL